VQVSPHIEEEVVRGFAATDARAGIAVSVLASAATVALSSPEAQAVLCVFSGAYALGMRRPRLLLVCYAIIAAMLVLALGCAALFRAFAPSMPAVPPGSLLVPFLRLAVMANVILPLAFATRLQSLLGSLKSFRLPFFLYIPLAVMIRFIPSFIADMKQIAEALRIRGYRLSWKQCLLHPGLTARFVSVPLLFRALKASENLGIAAELKGMGAGRSLRPCTPAVWRRRDSFLVAAALAVAAAALLCDMFFGADTVRLH
jgi:energy-coupling factor transport system permease protein